MSGLELIEIESPLVPSPVVCAVLLPPGYSDEAAPYPLCLNLHGGGSSHEALVNSQAFFEAHWMSGTLIPMVIAMANTSPLSFYFDDPEGDKWETFIAEELPAYLRANYNIRADRDGTVVTGVSMGGHGTLKIAFDRPTDFLAIAAMEPAIEPGLSREESPRRSQLYAANVSGAAANVIGPDADDEMFQRNSPAVRLVNNADAIRDSGMKIYLECGDHDALNLQDGTEYLHRLLWDLDISHEYHLVKDADHVGPSLGARLLEAMRFLSEALTDPAPVPETRPIGEAGRAWMAWTEGGMQGEGPEFDLMSEEGVAVLRAQFEPARKATQTLDPTTKRRYAVLPPSHL